jgi:hypothetical protein
MLKKNSQNLNPRIVFLQHASAIFDLLNPYPSTTFSSTRSTEFLVFSKPSYQIGFGMQTWRSVLPLL